MAAVSNAAKMNNMDALTATHTAQAVQAGQTLQKRRSVADSLNLNKDIRRYMAILLIVVTLILTAVGLAAICTKLQHINTDLTEQNACLQAEIDALNNEIVEETKISAVERTATKKYGMVYPTSTNCVKISLKETHKAGCLASKIRKKAYN